MKFLRRFLSRLTNFATRQRADQRLQEEIAEHLALQIEENLSAGMAPAEARSNHKGLSRGHPINSERPRFNTR